MDALLRVLPRPASCFPLEPVESTHAGEPGAGRSRRARVSPGGPDRARTAALTRAVRACAGFTLRVRRIHAPCLDDGREIPAARRCAFRQRDTQDEVPTDDKRPHCTHTSVALIVSWPFVTSMLHMKGLAVSV